MKMGAIIAWLQIKWTGIQIKANTNLKMISDRLKRKSERNLKRKRLSFTLTPETITSQPISEKEWKNIKNCAKGKH